MILVRDKVGDSFGLRVELHDVVSLEAVDQLAHVVGLAFDGREHGTVADGTVGAEEDEIVGEVGGGDAEVGRRLGLPKILEVLALWIHHGETRLEGGIEAGRADEHVNGVLFAVVTEAAALGDLVDLAIHDLDVLLAEGFEVANARSKAAATDMPVGDEALLKVGIVQLLAHLLPEVGLGLVVGVGVLEEDAELAVETALDVAAVFREDARLGCEFQTLLVGEDVLLKALDGRHPCWLANESRDFAGSGLNGGQDLDSRRAIEHVNIKISSTCYMVSLPIADESNMATLEVNVVIPVCGVQENALVFVQSRNSRPLPVV